MIHKPVLQKEVIKYLKPQKNENLIDATVGEGGHTILIAQRVLPSGKVLAIDWDGEIIKGLERRIKGLNLEKNVIPVCGSYIHLENFAKEAGLKRVKGILFDLGFSSWHIEKSKRGFSFLRNEPLDMRYNLDSPLTAKEIVNKWPERIIEKIIRIYGEEKFSQRIARKIVEEREKKEIGTTRDLVNIIERAIPYWYEKQRIHFATKTFQALRITVNSEIDNLKEGLEKSFETLEKGGRIAVISFHSLEDRIVKNFFHDKSEKGLLTIVNKKPITPSLEEIKKNQRSRSAKLRVAIKNI